MRSAVWMITLLIFSLTGRGQTQLVVNENDQQLVVMDFRDGKAWVHDPGNGQIRVSHSAKFELIETTDFKPDLITTRNFEIELDSAVFAQIPDPFLFSYAANENMESVVMAIELRNRKRTEVIVRRIGNISSHFGLPTAFEIPSKFTSGSDPYIWIFHFFCDGLEVPSTRRGWREVQKWLDRKVDSKIADQKRNTVAPIAWISPLPTYPTKLIEDSIKGTVEVLCRIDAAGFISEYEIRNPSHPSFGKAAERHLKYFRFIPRIRDGNPVASRVLIPFTFHPLPAVASP